eukprot:11024875-Alexandrium_andersonii.AAC.1
MRLSERIRGCPAASAEQLVRPLQRGLHAAVTEWWGRPHVDACVLALRPPGVLGGVLYLRLDGP